MIFKGKLIFDGFIYSIIDPIIEDFGKQVYGEIFPCVRYHQGAPYVEGVYLI